MVLDFYNATFPWASFLSTVAVDNIAALGDTAPPALKGDTFFGGEDDCRWCGGCSMLGKY